MVKLQTDVQTWKETEENRKEVLLSSKTSPADTVKVNDSQSSFKSLLTKTPAAEGQLVVQNVVLIFSSTAYNASGTNQICRQLSSKLIRRLVRKQKETERKCCCY